MSRQYSATDFSTSLGQMEQADSSITKILQVLAAMPGALLTEELKGVLGSDGSVSIPTTKAFTLPPLVITLDSWSENQLVRPYTTEVAAAAIKVKAKRTKGTLALSSGPFEDAPSGTSVKIFVVGI